jgi:cytochrome c-type biogenesis protein CcmH
MQALRILLLLAGVLAAIPAAAVQPDEMLADQRLETRARELSRELRCMVCQNQSIDDSDAALARDIRLLVRERLMQGDSDQAVLDYLVARYGDFILLKPRFNGATALLWLMPAAFVVIGIAILVVAARRRKGAALEGRLTLAEQARLARILRSKDK